MLVMKAGVPRVRVDELSFSADGSGLFAPALSAGLCYWKSLSSNAKAEVLSQPAKLIRRLVIAPDGRTLYAGSDQFCAFDLDRRSGAILNIPKWAALWFGVSPSGKRLVVAENPESTRTTRLTLWATDALDSPVGDISYPALVHSAPAFHLTGDRFLQLEAEVTPTQGWAHHRVTRSASTGAVLERSDAFPDDPDQMILSPDSLTVACRTRNTIRIYPATGSWGQVPVITNDGKQHFTGIAYHPSGKWVAATSNDKSVKMYDAASGQLTQTFTWDIGRMRSIAFNPDGTTAAAGSDTGKVVVWDVDA
jgi:WD40 repeat protein